MRPLPPHGMTEVTASTVLMEEANLNLERRQSDGSQENDMPIQRFHKRISGQKTPLMPSLDDALQDFLLHHKSKGSDPKTSYMFKYAVGKLIAFLGAETPLAEIAASDMRAFLATVQDTPTRNGKRMKVQAVHTIFVKLRTFFRWCESEEYIEVSPMKRLSPPRLDKALLPALEPNDIAVLDRALQGNDLESLRNRALVYTMLDSGIRLAESASLKVSDLDQDTGALLIRLGKGRKDRITRVGSTTLCTLVRYIRAAGLDADDPLWIGKRGALTRHGIRSLFEKLSKETGVHVHAHRARRTTALQMLRNGADIYSLQHLMGHSDLATLKKYLAQTEQDVAEVHKRCGVVDHLTKRARSR
ncbi:MAG: tyrosine-type recombinase/integrase [Fimbriimonadaceae bacterium]|nr:tyrosine-type recombinase/integrase [Fimbriimonadaceae bacterium]